MTTETDDGAKQFGPDNAATIVEMLQANPQLRASLPGLVVLDEADFHASVKRDLDAFNEVTEQLRLAESELAEEKRLRAGDIEEASSRVVEQMRWNDGLRAKLQAAESELAEAKAQLERAKGLYAMGLKMGLKSIESELAAALLLAEERLTDRNQLQADIEADQVGRMGLRKRHGAREDETFGAFVERLASELAAERARVAELLAMDQTWPLHDTLAKLAEAANILLLDKDYDGHGWELIGRARLNALAAIDCIRRSSQQRAIADELEGKR
jgi:hypothetical protein